MSIEYRGYVIEHEPPPIPTPIADYTWTHRDYDGVGGDDRAGCGSSVEDCKAQIDGQIEDQDEEAIMHAHPSVTEARAHLHTTLVQIGQDPFDAIFLGHIIAAFVALRGDVTLIPNCCHPFVEYHNPVISGCDRCNLPAAHAVHRG